MARNIVKAKLDIIFKKLFTDKDNGYILKCFISDILEIPFDEITKIEIMNTEVPPIDIDGKFSRLDLKLTVNNSLVNVEVQISDRGDFPERTLYYWAKTYGNQLKSGEEYAELMQTISVNIVNFSVFDTADYYSKYTMADLEHNRILTDKCSLHFFELRKINKNKSNKSRKELWMQLIDAESEEELEMLTNTGVPGIAEGVVAIKKMSADEKTRAIAEWREDRLREERSALGNAVRIGEERGRQQGMKQGMKQGIRQGIKQGREQGASEMRKKMVIKLIAAGMSDEEIKAIAEIGDGELKDIKNSN